MKNFIYLTLFALLASITTAEEVSLETPTGTLYGTLERANGAKDVLCVFHSGSGPTDRDCNIAGMGKNDALKMLAEALAEENIPSLRFDKRGIAASRNAALKESKLLPSVYVDDLTQWIEFAKNLGYQKVVLLGHSEGSLIALQAANKISVDAFISIAGTSEKFGDLIQRQIKPQLPTSLFNETTQIIQKLEAGERIADIPQWAMSLFRPSVQPYLIEEFQIDPLEEIKKLHIPICIIQGTTDLQIRVVDAQALASATTKAELCIIEGMNHVLKNVEGDQVQQMESYTTPDLPINHELTQCVVKFIQNLL